MSRWLITAALAMLLALAAHSHSAQAQSTWIPPSHRGAISSGGSGTSTNCASTGSGCTSCTYRRSSRGLLATAADPAGVASASTVSATATRITRRPIRGGSSSGSVSFGGSSGGATYNPWTGGSGSGGSGSGSSGSGSWSCNSCSSSGYYKLTQYAGVGTCGCTDHYGAVGSGSRSSAWQRYPAWPTSFQCQPCPDGYVPLGPDSNLLPSYNSDTGSWELKIASKVAANKANVRSAAARTDSNIGGVNAASAAAPFAPALTAKQQQVVVAKAQKAVQAASTEAPWYPYECVPCPPGFSVDFYGLTCEVNVCNDPAICGDIPSSSSGGSTTSSGGSTTSSSSSSGSTTSSSSSSGSTTSSSTSSSSTSSSSGSTSGGGGGAGTPCISCDTAKLSNLISTTCSADPNAPFFFADACVGQPGVTLPLFSSIPDIVIDSGGTDAGDCQKTANLKGQEVLVLWTIPDDQSVTCDRAGSFTLTIPRY